MENWAFSHLDSFCCELSNPFYCPTNFWNPSNSKLAGVSSGEQWEVEITLISLYWRLSLSSLFIRPKDFSRLKHQLNYISAFMRSFKTFGSKLLKTALHYIEDIILDQCRKRTSILPVFFFILKKLFSEKCLLGEKQRLSLFVKIQCGVLLGCLVCWLVGSQFQNSSNWNAFAIDMPLEVAAYFRCGIKTYIWQISISKFESIFQVFLKEIIVKVKMPWSSTQWDLF